MPESIRIQFLEKRKEFVDASGTANQEPNLVYIPIDRAAEINGQLDASWEPGAPLNNLLFGCQVIYDAPGTEIRFAYKTKRIRGLGP